MKKLSVDMYSTLQDESPEDYARTFETKLKEAKLEAAVGQAILSAHKSQLEELGAQGIGFGRTLRQVDFQLLTQHCFFSSKFCLVRLFSTSSAYSTNTSSPNLEGFNKN